jgi:hypothetical protein
MLFFNVDDITRANLQCSPNIYYESEASQVEYTANGILSQMIDNPRSERSYYRSRDSILINTLLYRFVSKLDTIHIHT